QNQRDIFAKQPAAALGRFRHQRRGRDDVAGALVHSITSSARASNIGGNSGPRTVTARSNFVDNFHPQVGRLGALRFYAGKILKSAKPVDLPAAQASALEFVVNALSRTPSDARCRRSCSRWPRGDQTTACNRRVLQR